MTDPVVEILTPDKPHLSRPSTGLELISGVRAVNCTNTDDVETYVSASLTTATQRAYLCDLAHFEAWGGSLPASPTQVATYLAAHATSLATATLSRRLASISKAHQARDLPNPTRAEVVKATLQGIRRLKGVAQRQAKPLLKEDLFIVLDAMGESIKDVRDRALLLIGFAGGFRRSELVGLNMGDIEAERRGVILHLRRSKTDQLGHGRKIAIPYGRTRHCPVSALEAWLAIVGTEGPLFRPVDRHARIGTSRLSGDAVSMVVRERIVAAGLDPTGYSGHSLRAGLATSAAQAGVPTWKIRQQTGHASDAMLSRYVRDGELFVGNAVSALL